MVNIFDILKKEKLNYYIVGGSVRDSYIGKESKDLDIVITNTKAEDIEQKLKKYGNVNMVGASFGVIKFTPKGGEEIDIAIPRTEKSTGDGHKSFEITSDHTLPIEKDLERRDFTINSIAKDNKGNIIDPFGGVEDIKQKLIRVTNPIAFHEDPLRMLRAVQFASRFNFTIEPKTFGLIKRNAKKIANISKERVLIEFDKIVKKGSPRIGAELLVLSNLYDGIFDTQFYGDFEHFDYVTRNSEFIYWLIESFAEEPEQYYKNVMKGDITTFKEISALSYLYNNLPKNDIVKQRWVYFTINKISPSMIQSSYVRSLLNDVITDFDGITYPSNLSELAITGSDLTKLGFKGKVIGDMLNKLLNAVFSDAVPNEKASLIKFAKTNKTALNESVNRSIGSRVAFYDFDDTLINSPKPPTDYPSSDDWWSTPESLDIRTFNIEPNVEILNRFRSDNADSNTHVVLLTNRNRNLAKEIKRILDKHNIKFEFYSFKTNSRDKGQRLLSIMKNKFPNIKRVEFYDDMEENIQSVINSLIDSDFEFNTHHVVNGKIAT